MKRLLWAHAKLGRKSVPLLTALSLEIQRQMRAFPPQALASIAWSWASLDFSPGQPALDRLVDVVLLQLASFQPQDLADLVWAFAKLHHTPGSSAMEKVVSNVLERSKTFTARQLITVLWGCACLGHLGAKVLAAPIMDTLESEAEVRHPCCCHPCAFCASLQQVTLGRCLMPWMDRRSLKVLQNSRDGLCLLPASGQASPTAARFWTFLRY